MNKHLFLDLEDTLITTWNKPELSYKKERVCDILRRKIRLDQTENPLPVEATIWSFAIWNDKDVAHFNNTMKKWLEAEYNIKIVATPTRKEILRNTQEFKNLYYLEDTELSSIFGKDTNLEYWLLAKKYTDAEVYLIDDTVTNKSIIHHGHNLRIEFFRV